MSAADPGAVEPVKPNGSQPPTSAEPIAADSTPDPSAIRAELEQTRSRMGSALSEMLSRADGDTIAGAVQNYLRMRSDPTLGPLVQQYETTGKADLPKPTGGDEPEEYLTDEQREIRQLRAEAQNLRSNLDELSLASGQQALGRHFERFLDEYPLEPGEAAAVRKHVEGVFQGWMREGEMGRKALRNIQQPGSYDTVEGLMLQAVSKVAKDALFQLGTRKAGRRRESLEPYRTDERTQRASDEPMPEFKSAAQALEFIDAHPERNPHRNRY